MAIYDPQADTWTMVDPPKGWDFIGNSPCTLLADGRLLLGQKLTEARRRSRSGDSDVD